MATSLKLDETTKERVKHVADLRDRSPHWIMKRAVEEFLEREERQEAFRSEAPESMNDYQNSGRHLNLEESLKWIESWGKDDEKRAPECHR